MSNLTVVKEILEDLGVEEKVIAEEKFLKRDFELDSTETVQIALELKRRLNVEIKFESKQDMTVGDLCRLVGNLSAAATAAK